MADGIKAGNAKQHHQIGNNMIIRQVLLREATGAGLDAENSFGDRRCEMQAAPPEIITMDAMTTAIPR